MSERDLNESPLRVPDPPQRPLARADIAGQFEALSGRRVVVVNEQGAFYDYRAVSEITVRLSGFGPDAVAFPYVAVLPEARWWAARVRGDWPIEPGAGVWWPAGAVWVEGQPS